MDERNKILKEAHSRSYKWPEKMNYNVILLRTVFRNFKALGS